MQVLEIVDTWVLGRIGRRDREIHLDLAWKLIWWGRPIFFCFSGPKDFADDGIAFAFLLFDRLGDFFLALEFSNANTIFESLHQSCKNCSPSFLNISP